MGANQPPCALSSSTGSTSHVKLQEPSVNSPAGSLTHCVSIQRYVAPGRGLPDAVPLVDAGLLLRIAPSPKSPNIRVKSTYSTWDRQAHAAAFLKRNQCRSTGDSESPHQSAF